MNYIDKNEHNEAIFEDINKKYCKFITSDEVFFEIMLMELRGCTIKYEAHKKRESD